LHQPRHCPARCGTQTRRGGQTHKGVLWACPEALLRSDLHESSVAKAPFLTGLLKKEQKKAKLREPRGMRGFKLFFEKFKNQAITLKH